MFARSFSAQDSVVVSNARNYYLERLEEIESLPASNRDGKFSGLLSNRKNFFRTSRRRITIFSESLNSIKLTLLL
jgi:hypothetical protein